MKQEQLNEILILHKKYLRGEKDGKCADLQYANLRGVNLRGVNLRTANLMGADLQYADLQYANLRDTDLRDTDLRNANLRGANLIWANLMCANLCDANLCDTDLSYANLWCVTLWYATLCYANLRDVNLRDANLRGANLLGAKNIPFLSQTIICPEKGSFIGFKKLNGFIVELEIPAESKRSSATTRKCRCEFAKVLSITNIDGTESGLVEIVNTKYNECVYRVGEIVYSDSFDEDRWNECSHGIHFFITRQEAVEY